MPVNPSLADSLTAPGDGGLSAVVTRAPGAEVDAGGPKRRKGKKEKGYGQVAKQGFVWAYFREGVSEMISTPAAMILARLLTPFEFGVAASAGFFLTLATRLAYFGFNQALVRTKELRPEHCSSVFVVSLLVGTVMYALLVGSAGLMAAFFREPAVAAIMPVAALTFLLTPLGTVPAALMTRNMQFRRTAAADWISSLGEATCTIVLAWLGYGYWSIVYGRVVGSVLNSSAKVLLGSWRPSLRFSTAAIRELFSFGAGVSVKRLLDQLAKSLDTLVVGRALGVTSLGFYDKAVSTMNKVVVRVNTGGPTLSFRIFSLISEERERFQSGYRKVVLATSLITYPLLVGLAAAGPEVIVIMYGEQWRPSVLPFQILCLAGALKVLNEYAGSAAQAGGHIWKQVSRQGLYALLVMVFVALFTRMGLAGAAMGVLLATIGMTLMMNGLLVRLTGIAPWSIVTAHAPGALAALCVAAAIVLVRAVFGDATTVHWQLLAAEVLAGAAAYALFLKFNRFREVRTLLRDTADDLGPPLGRLVRLVA